METQRKAKSYLVNRDLVGHFHLVELVDAAHTVVGKHHRAGLDPKLPYAIARDAVRICCTPPPASVGFSIGKPGGCQQSSDWDLSPVSLSFITDAVSPAAELARPEV